MRRARRADCKRSPPPPRPDGPRSAMPPDSRVRRLEVASRAREWRGRFGEIELEVPTPPRPVGAELARALGGGPGELREARRRSRARHRSPRANTRASGRIRRLRQGAVDEDAVGRRAGRARCTEVRSTSSDSANHRQIGPPMVEEALHVRAPRSSGHELVYRAHGGRVGRANPSAAEVRVPDVTQHRRRPRPGSGARARWQDRQRLAHRGAVQPHERPSGRARPRRGRGARRGGSGPPCPCRARHSSRPGGGGRHQASCRCGSIHRSGEPRFMRPLRARLRGERRSSRRAADAPRDPRWRRSGRRRARGRRRGPPPRRGGRPPIAASSALAGGRGSGSPMTIAPRPKGQAERRPRSQLSNTLRRLVTNGDGHDRPAGEPRQRGRCPPPRGERSLGHVGGSSPRSRRPRARAAFARMADAPPFWRARPRPAVARAADSRARPGARAPAR